MTTVINTHDMNSVLGIGENIIFLNKGHREWVGDMQAIYHSANEALNEFVFANDLFQKVKKYVLANEKPHPCPMPVIRINSLADPGLELYTRLTEAQLRNRLDPSKGIFIAESPKVIAVAMDAGYQPVSLLCEERHIEGDAAPLIARHPEMTVYTG